MREQRQVIRVADVTALAQAAANRILARMDANSGRIAICLSGGSTPARLYRLLATDAYRSRIPWERVHWFIGDERFVAASDQRNNMAMARNIFLNGVAPHSNIHPVPTDAGSAQQCAQAYELELKSFYGAKRLDAARPLFDVVLLGVGTDGHTASLFPGDPALEETEHWVVWVANAPVAPKTARVTLTLPVLGSCREMLFMAAGPEKRAILTCVLHGENLPAARAHSVCDTIFLADEAALPEDFRGK